MSDAAIEALPPEIHGLPMWIKIGAAAVLVVFLISLVQIGPVVQDAVTIERAHRHLALSKYQVAVQELKPIVAKYPDSIDFMLDFAQAEAGAGDSDGVAATLNKLEGREVSREQSQRGDEIGTRAGLHFQTVKRPESPSTPSFGLIPSSGSFISAL